MDEFEEEEVGNNDDVVQIVENGGMLPLDVGKDTSLLVGSQIKFTCRLKSYKDDFDIIWAAH